MKMCVRVYSETSVRFYPESRRHIYAVRILNAVDRIEDGTGVFWGTHDAKETSVQDFKEFLKGRNVRVWDDEIEMDLKETILVSHLILSLKIGEKQEFWEQQWSSFE